MLNFIYIASMKSTYYRIKRDERRVKRLYDAYYTQISSSKNRGLPPPEYSRDEFIDYYLLDESYIAAYDAWESAKFIKNMSPSFDRADNSKGYSFNNLNPILPWGDHVKKSGKERKKRPTDWNCTIRVALCKAHDDRKRLKKRPPTRGTEAHAVWLAIHNYLNPDGSIEFFFEGEISKDIYDKSTRTLNMKGIKWFIKKYGGSYFDKVY